MLYDLAEVVIVHMNMCDVDIARTDVFLSQEILTETVFMFYMYLLLGVLIDGSLISSSHTG